MHNIAFEALYLPFISPNLAALLIGQSLEAGLKSVVPYRSIATFQTQLLSQRGQLMTILGEFTTKLSGDTTLPPNSERALRQVVHHLHHLKKVWQHVLPPNIYLRAIGVIVNSVVETMVNKVIALEDIAADAAVQISNVFNAFLDKAPGVFAIDGNAETSV